MKNVLTNYTESQDGFGKSGSYNQLTHVLY